MSAPSLAFHSLSLRYGEEDVISDFTGTIQPGEFIAVLGPNGAGKSTLLKALLGLLKPASGSLEIFGEAPQRGNPLIGYMPQLRSNAVTSSLSGRAYLHAVLEGHRWGFSGPSKEKEALVHRALEAVDALRFMNRPFDVLSGGERQRISLAQALLGQPRILLLDEPLLNLDPRRQGELIEMVDSVRRQLGVTVLFVGHDVNPLSRVMDRVLYIAGGRAALGTVEEVITSEALSKLYHANMKVFHVEDMVFIMAADNRIIDHGDHFH